MHDIDIRRLDLNLLFAFDALWRERGVTRAAERIGLSQSAMSHALKRLRDFYDDPLFVRIGDTMKPTPKAEQLGPAVIEIVRRVQADLLGETVFDARNAQRTFRIATTDMGELVFLPRLMKRLEALAPGCALRTLQIAEEDIEGALECGEADLALGSLSAVSDKLVQQQLFLHSFVTLVNPHTSKIGQRLDLETFQSMKHVVVTLSGKTAPYDRLLEERGIRRNIFLTTPHFLVVPLLIEEDSDLVATMPYELGRVFQKYNAVRMLPPPLELPDFAIRQLWHPRHHHDEGNQWLRELIKTTFDGYPFDLL